MAEAHMRAISKGQEYERYAGKFNLYTFMVIVTGATSGLLLGYDNGVMGGVQLMEDFQKKFFYSTTYKYNFIDKKDSGSPYCKYDDKVYQLLISSTYLGAAVCAIAAEIIARHCGRKPTMVFSGLSFTIGAAILAGAQSLAMLFCGRVILGLGIGAGTMVGPVYLSEIAPMRIRGALNVTFQLFVTIGILAAGLINYASQWIRPWGWRLPLGLAGIPGLFLLIAGAILPESPASLAERGHLEKARKVLQKVRGIHDVDAELTDIMCAATRSQRVKNPYRNLCSSKYRPQLVIPILLMAFQQFDGINAVIFYAPILFESVASGALGGLLDTVIISSVNVVATLGAIIFVDRAGRRALLLYPTAWMCIMQIILAVVLGVEFHKYGQALPSATSIGILVIICAFVVGHAIGLGPVSWLYPTEVQPLETRAAAAGINTASNMVFTFVIAQCFASMLCAFKYGAFLFFAGCLVIAFVFMYFMFPETSRIRLESAHTVFRQNKYWLKLCPAIQEVHAMDVPSPELQIGKPAGH